MKSLNITNPASEAGFALGLTLVLVVVIGAMITGAVTVGGYNILATRNYERTSELHTIALSGLELARARINGNPDLYPDSAYVTLEDGVTVTDGAGEVIPGVRRWLYAGPTGVTTGQYGIFGSIVAVVEDDGGARVIRRTQISQKSFARFVYFTDDEADVGFNGDEFWGPVHSNDDLLLWGDVSTWHNELTTAGEITRPDLGIYDMGYEENVAPIPMPETADLDDVRAQATRGGTHFTSTTGGNENQASMRIEFVALDLNGDGDTTDENEGFFKVYENTSNLSWLSASLDSDLRNNQNCGRWYSDRFYPAAAHTTHGVTRAGAVNSSAARCYLGGDSVLTNSFQATDTLGGRWIPWTGARDPGLTGRSDAGYLWPLSRRLNPNFKGVIAVRGKVGVSGVLRGNVTLAATQDIVILDDLTYATDPGTGTCQDMLGLFAGRNITVSHNLLNAAQRPWSGKNRWYTYDDTSDEFIHGVILALNQFGAGDWDQGAITGEDCQGGQGGRGCLYITGGLIQETRGAVGATWTGYWKKYSWDACALAGPPPYFPTTGHFRKGQYYDVDPVGFSVDAYYQALTPGT